jgi:biotin synthase
VSCPLDVRHLEKKILQGTQISRQEAGLLSQLSGSDIFSLFASANKIRQHYRGNTIGLCSIVNAKSGACTEDCTFCAQSTKSRAKIIIYPLLSKKTILQKAEESKRSGIKRFSIVTSGKKTSGKDIKKIMEIISGVRQMGVLPCASLGLLSRGELLRLKEAGLDRYHHNLETSQRFFPRVCSTHGYTDKVETIEAAKSVGLSICSGGIYGLGETWRDRIDLAFSLKKLDVDSVPVNFLIPIKGTRLGTARLLKPLEALKIVSIYRHILPKKEIRVCGGRIQVLGELNSMVFLAGADGVITGNYLTTLGRNPEDDLKLIEILGLRTEKRFRNSLNLQ